VNATPEFKNPTITSNPAFHPDIQFDVLEGGQRSTNEEVDLILVLAGRRAARLKHPLENQRRNHGVSQSIKLYRRDHVLTSVISNLTRPMASLSAMAR